MFRAAVRETEGTGHHRQFSFSNLGEALIARELQGLGVNVAMIGRTLHGLRYLDDKDEPPEEIQRWFQFRNPATRPDGWEARMYLWPAPEAPQDVFRCVIQAGKPEDFPRLVKQLKPGRFIMLTIDLGNIVRFLEERTHDDWWRPVGYHAELRAIDEARKANLAAEREAEEDAGIDSVASEHPEVALDRRLRAECGLPRREYNQRFWRSIKIPGLKTVPKLMTEELAKEYKRSHPQGSKAHRKGKK